MTVAGPQDVVVDLTDMLGRLIRSLYAGDIEPGNGITLELEAETIAPGVYLLIVRGTNELWIRRRWSSPDNPFYTCRSAW
ncbi:MAG: hypothetical protein ACOCTG_00325 [Bacteroidota bacterium]